MTNSWSSRLPPTLEDFDLLAREAFESLPERFRALCGDVVLHVADFAEEQILKDLAIESPFDLTGLYEGVDVRSRSIEDATTLPNHVHLYRQPILSEWIDDGQTTLGDLVRHILIHEIGHHFGLSDADMALIEARR